MTTVGIDSFLQLAQTAPQTTTAQPVAPAGLPGGVSAAPAQPVQAQTAQPLQGSQPAGIGAPAAKPPGMMSMMFLPLLLVVLLVFMTFWTGRREKKKREEMLKTVVKGAKVVTNGGIIGTVVEANDQDLVLRVEEGRIRVTRNAVGGVLSEGKASSTAELKNAAVTTNA